jgi:N-acetylmuramoyl-L-alanine amidase
MPAVKILAFLLIASALTIVISESVYYNDAYIEAMHTESERRTVILDAGHGGEDSGAVGINGTLEKNLNLDIAILLGTMLRENGFAVVYTRTDDKLLYTEKENIKGIRKISDLKNRCKIGAEYPEALFISIHQNSYGSEKYSGLQVYYKPGDSESTELAKSIQKCVKNEVQPDNKRSIKSGEKIYLLENCINTSVLIECGFITNESECEKLLEKEYQKELCSAIICGIIDYKEENSES